MRYWLLAWLALLSVASAQIVQFSGAPISGFVIAQIQANPNVTITAITPSITCSRSSGQTPMFVQCSASAATATGSAAPYEDLGYSWNFGDAAGTETFNQPLASNLKSYSTTIVNANNAQTGPEAAYVYRSAGTYTVTLYSSGANGGGYTNALATTTITVTTFNASGGEYWFDSVGGSDSNNGLSAGAPKQSLSAMNALLGQNVAFHLKRGSSWSGQLAISGGTLVASPLRFDAYGTGANPIFTNSSAATISINNGSAGTARSKTDIVFSNIDAENTGANIPFIVSSGNATATMDNIYIDGGAMSLPGTAVSVVSLGHSSGFATRFTNYGLWNVAVSNTLTPGTGTRQGVDGSSQEWFFVFGGSIAGAGGSAVLDHHMYPDVKINLLVRYVAFGSGPSRNYNVNANCDDLGAGLVYSEFILISDNYMSGTARGIDEGNTNNDATKTQFRNFVVQRNAVSGLTGGYVAGNLFISMTVRDNLYFGNTGAAFVGSGAPAIGSTASLQILRSYRNRIYQTADTANIFDINVASLTQPQQITDNITQDTRVTARPIATRWTDQVSAGSIINRNQWWAPNDGDSNFFYDNTTAKSFTLWQGSGFDAAGSVANPNWVDPANGNFNFLLKRDLDPAANDNSPMWLGKVA